MYMLLYTCTWYSCSIQAKNTVIMVMISHYALHLQKKKSADVQRPCIHSHGCPTMFPLSKSGHDFSDICSGAYHFWFWTGSDCSGEDAIKLI